MEALVAYGSFVERPRLVVVNDDGGAARYSALPHAVLTDPRTQHGHIVTYAVLQMHWWQGGECWASHATLATEAKCSVRQLQRYLKDLAAWGYVIERRKGLGQSKAYAPAESMPQHDTGDRFNTTPVSPLQLNTTPVSDQHDTHVAFNTTPVSDQYRRTEEDSPKEEDTGVGAADAAQPASAKPKAAKPSRGTRCPETFDLTERHLTYAATLGFTPAQTRAETDKFLAHHRFKGTVGVDWYAGWQNWLRKALTFAAQQQPRNGAAPKPTVTPRPAQTKPANVRTY